MNIRCDDSLVQMYVEGALAPTERTVVAAHIRTCPDCQKRVLTYKAMLWDLAHPEPESEPALPEQLQAMSERLLTAWEQRGDQPAGSPARAIWNYSLLWLRAMPVTANLAGRLAPAAKRAAPALGRGVLQAGRWVFQRRGAKRR